MSTLKRNFFTLGDEMLTLQQIRDSLKDRRIGLLAEMTGIHVNTLRDIRDNENANPTYKTLQLLNDYFSGADNGK